MTEGDPGTQLYLIRRKRGRVAHLWDDPDTRCRMVSTGGLNVKRYTVLNSPHGRDAPGEGGRSPRLRAPPERGPVGGRRGGAPRQPLPGTREAWPQGVCWLSHIRVAQASPADASETRSEQPPGTAGEGPTLARQIGRPVVHEPVAPRTESGGGNDDGGDYDDRRGAHQALVHDGGALCRVAAFRPTVTPRRPAIVRQRRSYGPQLSGNARGTPRKRPLSPSRKRRHNRGVVRLRCSLSAPPDTPPTAPSAVPI